jgi:hypothetical protein
MKYGMRKNILFIVGTFFMVNAYAEELINNECRPNGLVNSAKAIYSPRKFWRQALNELENAVNNLKQSSEYDLLKKKSDEIRSNLEDQEFEKLGIRLYKSTEEDKRLDKETDDLLAEGDRWLMESTIKWVEKCRPYVIRKIGSNK